MTKRKAPIVGKFTFNHSEWWFINCLWWFIGILGLGTGHFSGRYNPLFNAWSQAWNLALFVHGGPLPENWEFSEPIRMLLALFSRQSFLCFWSQPQRVKSMDLGFEKKAVDQWPSEAMVKPWWSHEWGQPDSWMLYFMENPSSTWMRTRGIPMAMEMNMCVG